MERSLKKKLRYFLSSHYRGRTETQKVLEDMQHFGPTVLIGGILRDLALYNNTEFRSDVDVVIDPMCPDSFRKHVEGIGAKKNRFGGYTLPYHKWRIDIWVLQETWARQNGHAHVDCFRDLVNTTFFNSDAIIYDLSNETVITKPGYFTELSRRFLEINLRPNPNPLGNAVRALRYAIKKDFAWGPKLSQFIEETLNCEDWESLINYERGSFGNVTIDELCKEQFEERLKKYIKSTRGEYFVPISRRKITQLKLPFAK